MSEEMDVHSIEVSQDQTLKSNEISQESNVKIGT